MGKKIISGKGLFLAILLLSGSIVIASVPNDMYLIRNGGISKIDATMNWLGNGEAANLGDINDAAFNGKTGELIVLRNGNTITRMSANLKWLGNTDAPGALNKVAINHVTGNIYVAYEDATTNASIMRYDENMNPLGVQEATNCDMITAMAVNPVNGDVVVARSHPDYDTVGYLSAYDSELYYHYDYGNGSDLGIRLRDIAINQLGEIFVDRGGVAVTKFNSNLSWAKNTNGMEVSGIAVHPTSNDLYVGRMPGLSWFDNADILNGFYGNCPFGLDPTTGVVVNGDGNVIVIRSAALTRLTPNMQTWLGNSGNYDYIKKVVVISGWAGPKCGDGDYPYPVADLSGPDGNKDCKVDMYDFAVLAQSWMLCENPQSCN